MRWQDKQMYGEKKMTHQNEALSFEQFHSSHTLAAKKRRGPAPAAADQKHLSLSRAQQFCINQKCTHAWQMC